MIDQNTIPILSHEIDCVSNPYWLGDVGLVAQLEEGVVSGTLPHGIVLEGNAGIGKATLALRLARFILWHGREAGQNIGGGKGADTFDNSPLHVPLDSATFRWVASGAHPDLLVLSVLDGSATQTIKVEQIRAVEPFFRKTASMGKWRVVVIDGIDTVNRNGQNALLKILEEPPAYCVLILTANNGGVLLPTIRSRCRFIPVPPVSAEVIAAVQQQWFPDMPSEHAAMLTRLAAGSIGYLKSLGDLGIAPDLQHLWALLGDVPKLNWAEILKLAEHFAPKAMEDNFRMVMKCFLEQLSDILLMNSKESSVARHKLPKGFDKFTAAKWLQFHDSIVKLYQDYQVAGLDRNFTLTTFFYISEAVFKPEYMVK